MQVFPQTFTGSSDRFAHNLAALQVLATIEQAQRSPDAQEYATLAQFTSFGESALLSRLLQQVEAGRVPTLTSDDVASLRRAALTAFYTPLDVAGVIWSALEQLGIGLLPTLRVLEPAAGVGNLLAAMPQELRERAQITAVELELVSARIFRQLHLDCTLHAATGFQDVLLPDNVFDLAISNVPFGDFGVADATLAVNERFLASRIHDYFLTKMLKLVRPGGIVAALTSYGTLDKHTTRVRQWIAERADLLAAYRLPSGLFATNAGSQAGADLLILQKHPAGGIEAQEWREVTPIEVTPWTGGKLHTTSGARYGEEHDEVQVNQYFADRPAHIIGTPYEIRRNGYLFYSVQPPTATDLASALHQCIETTLPRDVVTDAPVFVPTRTPACREHVTLALRLDDIAGTHQLRATALAAVYGAAKALIRSELDTASTATTLDSERQALNDAYDAFVSDYGIISSPTNRRIFARLPELPFLQALEDQPRCVGGGWIATKAPLFTRRTLRALPRVVDGTLSVQDALIRSLDTTGTVDMPLIVRLSGQSADAVRATLTGVIFRTLDLTTEAYETADAFLSGNVRVKLRQAQALAALNPAFAGHVAALETVQPTLLGPEAIIVRLGAVWVPSDVITAFVQHLIPTYRASVTFRELDASWHVQSTEVARTTVANTATWGTARMSALDLIESLLNSRPIIVRDTVERLDGSTITVVNDTETAAAQEKADAVRQAFRQWIWSEPDRTHRLVTIYNERFNALRPRVYDGSHLSLPGLNTAVLRDGDLSEWQKAAVWQGLQQPATLLAHAVGAGKTYTMITIAREARRMGLAAKPCMLVPNHLVGQTARAAQHLFPGLHVLALGEQDFARDRRGVALSRIATGDWDLVIVPFSSFQFLPVDEPVLDHFYDGERQRLRDALEAAQDAARTATDTRSARTGVKRIEKALERLEVRLKNTLNRIARDSAQTITWRELGIDLLMVDEAHAFKNLYVPSRLTVAGAPQADSLRALDLRIKTWDMLRQGQKVVFATATPIMNTLGEAFVMQLYLQEQELAQMGIDSFDAWVSVFAEVRDLCELKPDGSGFQVKSRLNTFINLPELAQFWSTVLNVRTAEQLALPRPELVGDKPVIVAVPTSPALERLTRQFVQRVERIKLRQVDPTIDNMLKVTSDARLAALDPRLLIGGAEAPQSKLSALADRVTHLYHTYDAARGTQLVFCDLATPKSSAVPSADGASASDAAPDATTPGDDTLAEQALAGGVYHAIRAKLAARGIPAAEVAFIHDYHTNAARDALFAAMNAGTIRVLIGSTAKMGTGMNVQQRLIALHQLDAPWRPGDVEQRNGRILRQGNMWPQTYVFHYVTEGSFDSYIWQLLENKARFIAQVITGEVTARSADDVGDTVLTAAEVKAIASGNPRVFEHFAIQNQCAKLERVRRSWNETRHALTRKRVVRVDAIATRQTRSAELAVAQQIYAAHAADDFTLTLGTGVDSDEHRTYTNRDDAGAALERLARHTAAAAEAQHHAIRCTIGEYRGFTLRLDASPFALRAAELRLVYAQEGQQITAVERVLDEDLTARGIISSLDASLRDLGARITRNARLDAEDTQQIAACEAELERTAVWEHAERYAHLHARLDALTNALRAVNDTSATAPQTRMDTAAVTDAAEETALPVEEIVPAEALAATFVADDIPPAPRSLVLLAAPPIEPAPVVFVPDAAPTRTALASSPRPQPAPAAASTPAPRGPRFGDHTLLRQQRYTANARANRPAPAPAADVPTQLDLFAL